MSDEKQPSEAARVARRWLDRASGQGMVGWFGLRPKSAVDDLAHALDAYAAARVAEAVKAERRTHRALMRSLRDATLGQMKAAVIVAEVAREKDGAVDGETLQGYIRARGEQEGT